MDRKIIFTQSFKIIPFDMYQIGNKPKKNVTPKRKKPIVRNDKIISILSPKQLKVTTHIDKPYIKYQQPTIINLITTGIDKQTYYEKITLNKHFTIVHIIPSVYSRTDDTICMQLKLKIFTQSCYFHRHRTHLQCFILCYNSLKIIIFIKSS